MILVISKFRDSFLPIFFFPQGLDLIAKLLTKQKWVLIKPATGLLQNLAACSCNHPSICEQYVDYSSDIFLYRCRPLLVATHFLVFFLHFSVLLTNTQSL